MKKVYLMLTVMATVYSSMGFAQDSTNLLPPKILAAYYQLKDALASDQVTSATSYANEFIIAINETSTQTLKMDQKAALLKDGTAIAQAKNIEQKREKFASLSNTLLALSKTMKLSTQPVYQQYCPMKKSNWLSNETAIKNPYYGSAMLTCGRVVTSL